MTDRSGWEHILDEGEEILWQGRPSTAFRILPRHVVTFLFGLFFSGFALFWMVAAARDGGFAWTFGLIHFSAGIAVAIGPVWWDDVTRKNTWYTLTDHRAFIATDLPLRGRRLKSYPINPHTQVDFRPDEPASIYFASEYRRSKNGMRRVDIGFEAIADGETVLGLIRDIQKARQ